MNLHLAKRFPVYLLFSISVAASAQTIPSNADVPTLPIAAESAINVQSEESIAPISTPNDSVDPWQSFNRTMFSFNDTLDRHLLKPLAKAYVRTTPRFFRQGVGNVFSNILGVPTVLNDVLQGKFSRAAHDTGRVVINSTLGLVGIFDVAQHMGLEASDEEDFGQTLAVWGVSSGPYLVLPLMGPSTLRDSAALPVDWYSDPKAYIEDVRTKNTLRVASLVNTRASFLALEKSLTGDKYVFIRDAYLQRRNFQVLDGNVEDSFGIDAAESGDYGY